MFFSGVKMEKYLPTDIFFSMLVETQLFFYT